jgi:hypothetical protein
MPLQSLTARGIEIPGYYVPEGMGFECERKGEHDRRKSLLVRKKT